MNDQHPVHSRLMQAFLAMGKSGRVLADICIAL
jgi:hypothetical protein